MVKNIRIKLRGPICNCKKQNLGWGVILDNTNRYGLQINCNDCQVTIILTFKEFRMGFDLDVPYPEGVKPEETEVKEQKDAKVLHLAFSQKQPENPV